MSQHDDEAAREAESAARRKALAEQIAARPIEEVVGIVAFGGKGGSGADGGLKRLRLSLRHWRIGSGPLKSRELTTMFTIPPEEFDALWSRVHSLDVVRLRARVVEDSAIGEPRAEVVEFVGHDDDPELARLVVDLKTPVVHEDPDFGELVLDRATDWFKADVRWYRSTIELMVIRDESGSPELALATARALWSQPKAWTTRVKDLAVQQLLPLKNEDWLDEGESPLTPERFLRKLKLESIAVNPDGSFEFWFDDGNLFSGHMIQVDGTLTEGPTRTQLAG
ncbi:DUF2262 domain-containing protein [Paludisphaera sp.]|uniref:DUF2262 domain-containing protein n=1 Tax=Paludisphaera sp. TaxID=2017432 RepID=UPI00301B9EFE